VLLWDSAKIHRNQAVRLYLRRCRRLHLHHFPAYALELNPDEHFWTQTKQTLANSTPASIDKLQDGVGNGLLHLQHSTQLFGAASMLQNCRGSSLKCISIV
jgi:transposase